MAPLMKFKNSRTSEVYKLGKYHTDEYVQARMAEAWLTHSTVKVMDRVWKSKTTRRATKAKIFNPKVKTS